MLDVLKDVGFTAIQGVGGYLHLATKKFEMLHQTAIYAPPVKAGEDRYEDAANMLDFPNGGDFKPQPWVPRDVATYASFNFKPKKAFESSKTLVNAIVGDQVFDDLIYEHRRGSERPAHQHSHRPGRTSGRPGDVVSDYLLPITPQSERIIVAVETSNSKKLAANIEKQMKADQDATRREYKGHVIWEIINADDQPAIAPVKKKAAKQKEDEDEESAREHLLPNSAVTVAHGQLLVASHYDFLTKMLDELAEREQLVDGNEYHLVKTELDYLSGGKACAEIFSRTDEDYRAVYELIRAGRMPEAETMLGNLLNRFLGEGKPGVRRTQRINGKALPEYDAVRRYFGPAGMTAMSEDDGWFLTGFTLSKEPAATVAEGPAAASETSSTAPSAEDAVTKVAG